MRRKYRLAENALKKAARINDMIADARKRVYDKAMAPVPHSPRPARGNLPMDIAEMLESDTELVELEHIQKVIFTDFALSAKVPERVKQTIFRVYLSGGPMSDIQKKHRVSARTVRRWRQQGLEWITKLLTRRGTWR